MTMVEMHTHWVDLIQSGVIAMLAVQRLRVSGK